MRTHSQIISDAGPAKMAAAAGFTDANTVYQWRRNNSIPAPYWKAIVTADMATLDELAEAASTKRPAEPQHGAAA